MNVLVRWQEKIKVRRSENGGESSNCGSKRGEGVMNGEW